jgi:WhiB family redox-sensing transcriptional regulator
MPPGAPPCALEPSLWFSTEDADVNIAKTSCRDCPIRVPCLRGAIDRGEPWGVWGGELFHRGVIVSRAPRQGRAAGAPVERAVG